MKTSRSSRATYGPDDVQIFTKAAAVKFIRAKGWQIGREHNVCPDCQEGRNHAYEDDLDL